MDELLELAKQNLAKLEELNERFEQERGVEQRSAQVAHNHQIAGSNPAPATKPRIEVDPKKTPAPIAFAGKISEILHKDQKLRLVTKDFATGKCDFNDWVDFFFEACQNTYKGMDYAPTIESAINILLEKGYTLEQEEGFLIKMREVAQG